MGSENRKHQEQVFPSSCRNPRAVPSVAGYTRKNVLFAHSTPQPRVRASQRTDHGKTSRVYTSLSWESSMPSLRAVGSMCLAVSLGTWEPVCPISVLFFLESKGPPDLLFYVSQNVDTDMGQVPTPQAIPRDTDHLRPSNLVAKTLGLVDHTLSKLVVTRVL